jgi:hypothetical protein
VPQPGRPLAWCRFARPHLRNLAQCPEPVTPGDEHPVPATRRAVITGAEERHAGDRHEHALEEAAAAIFRARGGDVHYRVRGEAEGIADQVTDPWHVLLVRHEAERIARGKGRAVEVTVLFNPEHVLQRAVGSISAQTSA